jgi:hypothetical protein
MIDHGGVPGYRLLPRRVSAIRHERLKTIFFA